MAGLRTYAVKFGYRGTAFDGYARQPRGRTVEGELVRALGEAGVLADPRHLRSGSRTDRGVSALGNVAAVATERDPATLCAAANAHLEDAWLWAWRPVDATFNPRHARRRRYAYTLPDPGDVRLALAKRALRAFVGRHDMSSFARVEAGRDPVREVTRASLTRAGGALRFVVEAPNFLWHQVRRMVAATLAAGRAEATAADLEAALRDPRRHGHDWGVAPAEPLVLEDVAYPFRFHVDERGARVAARRLGELWRDRFREERFLRSALRTLRPR